MAQRQRCPVKGCRRYQGTHDHVRSERSTEAERELMFLVKVPFYGNDEKMGQVHDIIARALHFGMSTQVSSTPATLWDEEELPDGLEFLVYDDTKWLQLQLNGDHPNKEEVPD